MEKLNDFHIPTRQATAAVILFFIKFLKISVKQAWPFILSVLYGARKMELGEWQIYLIVIGTAAIYLTVSILSYLKFYYYVKDNEIVIEKGIISKTKLNIPFEKVQTVNFKQNVVQQIFKVVTFEVDSAGSNKQEISLSAITEDKANQLREYILTEKQKIDQTEKVPVSEEQTIPESVEEKTILKLGIADLIKVGVTQNHFKSLGILMAFVFWIYSQYTEIFQGSDVGEEEFKEAYQSYHNETILLILFFGFFLFLTPFFISLIASVVRNFDLIFSISTDGLKLRNGLFNKQQRSTTLKKVQVLAWGRNPLQKLLQLFTIKVYPAASSQQSMKKILNIPGSKKEQVEEVINTLFASEDLENMKEHRIQKNFISRNFLMLGIVPSIIAIILSFYFFGFNALYWMFLLPVSFLVFYFRYQKWRYFMNEEVLKIQHGLFGLHHKLIYWYKIQAVRISQTPYQLRKGLANIHFYMAGNYIKIPYIKLEKAIAIQNYVLYKIESDKRDWM
ncbi:PH domain-containing protein [Fulvivirgaceae bacterium BMA10]|uniref:PH domain-containing protein n=1 Tax=Splendidivirga corallicola TaxID=3051826 RepID=A0ABT8KU05_9BACT|nr:PH domain-containing protein [Fulvivirgaceae bacterium BMA10]